MDFSTLLGLAEENKDKKKTVARFSLKVAPPKKTPKDQKLSENVRRFLESKNEEAKQKKKEADAKKAKLLEMRRGNSKSVRTMNSMLKRTKSSNKAALEEAKNKRDTNATLAGREQCDEDDYGYESNAARGFYESLMNKYEKNPEDPMAKFSRAGPKKAADISQTVARVKDRLENAEEDEIRARKLQRQRDKMENSSKSHEPVEMFSSDHDKKSKRVKDEVAARKRRLQLAQKVPAPPSFNDLIKMAQQKQKEPIQMEQKKEAGEGEFKGRPMTQKEKEEYLRERQSHLRKTGKIAPSAPYTKKQLNNGHPQNKNSGSNAASSSSSSALERIDKKQPPNEEKVIKPPKYPVIKGPEFHPAVVKASSSSTGRSDKSQLKKQADPSSKSASSSYRAKPSSSGNASRKRSRSPSPIPQHRSNQSSHNRIESDYEEEEEDDYDSEMDDFIDDSDSKMDVSAEIGRMFGYNRHKYKDEDDFDDRAMENNRFSDLMKEEARSARIGRMEDEEDMRREEEEKRLKKMKKKRR